MRHLIGTPISKDRFFANTLIFFVIPYFTCLIYMLESDFIGGYSCIIFILLLFITSICVAFSDPPLHTKEIELIKGTHLIIKAEDFFVLYKYKLIMREAYPGIYFLTKKAVIKYCLELEKKKLKEGANNIPSVMRLQAML